MNVGVIGGEEITNIELCEALEEGISLTNVKGLIIHNADHSITLTPERPEITDINRLPWPDYDGFELEKNFKDNFCISGINSKRSIFIRGSHSIPNPFSFYPHIAGKNYRQRTLDSFFEELDYDIKKYNIEYLHILGELFSDKNDERIIEFCKRIKPYSIKWEAKFPIESLNPHIIVLIRESGCRMLSFDLKSVDMAQKNMEGTLTIEQIDKTLRALHKEKIPFKSTFLFGDEAETYKTAMKTLDYWEQHKQYHINLDTIKIFPGSSLYNKAKKCGRINPVRYLQDGCPPFNNTKMSMEEYADIIRRIEVYPFSNTDLLKDIELFDIDYKNAKTKGRGKCKRCGIENEWEQIELFATNFWGCKGCNQKYYIEIPQNILIRLEENIKKLCQIYGKIAVWGCNYHTIQIFEKVPQLKENVVFPIDVSEVKQKLDIGKRKIYSPDIIEKEHIRCVVIAIPAHFNHIELQIHYQYPMVENVIGIGELLKENQKEIHKGTEKGRISARIATGEGSGGKYRAILRKILPLDTPLAIEFFNIHACNFKCKFCAYSLSHEEQGFHFEREVMELSLFKKCIDDLREFPQKIKMVRFVGIGEPLLHPQIDEMVKYAVNSDIADKVEIITNGSLLTPELSDRLIDANLSQMRISVEGLDEATYEEVTGKKIDINKFINNIRYFYVHKKNTILNIKAVDYNIKTKEQINEFYRLFGNICDSISIEHVVEIASKVDYAPIRDHLSKKTMRGEEIEDIDICPHPYYIMQICPDGTVFPCCSSENAPNMGNCSYKSLLEIWNGNIFNDFRYQMLNGAKACGGICAVCKQYLYNTFPEDKIYREDAVQLKKYYKRSL